MHFILGVHLSLDQPHFKAHWQHVVVVVLLESSALDRIVVREEEREWDIFLNLFFILQLLANF